MTDCIFAHFVYGVKVELSEEQELQLTDRQILIGNEEHVTEDGVTLESLDEAYNEICDYYREKYGMKTDVAAIHVVSDDARRGSHAGSGDCFFGVGVVQFPVYERQELEDIRSLGPDATWYSWVT